MNTRTSTTVLTVDATGGGHNVRRRLVVLRKVGQLVLIQSLGSFDELANVGRQLCLAQARWLVTFNHNGRYKR